ncbi:MAG TPA: CbiX/SirB N-terminal domain-containing protein [Opitutales bacterium]|nr:CbiX/SirB N-terminal domain-containing protein [Opitutales bacterium]
MPPTRQPIILLVDNGSLEPAATLALRKTAARLAEAVKVDVRPVSLLHSSAIAPELLEGRPAAIVEPTLRTLAEANRTNIVIVPFFIGPSGAILNYLPERVRHLRKARPRLTVRIAPCLVDAASTDDRRVAALLAERVRAAAAREKFTRPAVAVVDHGTPERAVNAVRELVARQTRSLLGSSARAVAAGSMERRSGGEFDFNEPLLERLLDQQDFSAGEVIIARLFLLPGRHAGPGGDIEQIAQAAAARHAQMKVAFTEPLGTHPGLIPILGERLEQGLAATPIA